MRQPLTRRRVVGCSLATLGLVGAQPLADARGGGQSAGPDFGGYLDAANNYDGTVADRRGQTETTVEVGVDAGGGDFGFGPPAVHVDNGTTVKWEWVGSSPHNVYSADDGPLDSGEPTAEGGVHYQYTFETDGIYLYRCQPHGSLGMRGAIVVGTDYPRRTPTATPTPEPTAVREGTPLAAAPESDWRSRESGPTNQSFVPGTSGPQNDVDTQWVVESTGPVFDPVLGDGALYFSVWDRYGAVAVDAASGERRWAREVPGRVRAVDSERVYATSDSGFVFALDAATGETRWSRQDAQDGVTDLQVADGRVYAAIGDSIEAFDAAGSERERLLQGENQFVGLAVADGTLYASEQAHFGTGPQDPELVVRALDPKTGTERWSFRRKSYPPTRPTVAEGTVYVGTGSHAIHAIDAIDGTERWRADLGSSVNGLAVVPDAASEDARGMVYAGCNDYRLYAFDAETGERRWRERTRGVVNTPAVADGLVYATNRGYIDAELEDDGSVETETDGSVAREMAVQAFDAATGDRRWTVELDSQADTGSTPAYVGDEPVVADGVLYAAVNTTDHTFKLYALGGAAAREEGAGTTDDSAAVKETHVIAPGPGVVATALGVLGVAGWLTGRDGGND
jgi:halocyanin-like protein